MNTIGLIALNAFPRALTAAGCSVAALMIAVSLTGLILVFHLLSTWTAQDAEFIWTR